MGGFPWQGWGRTMVVVVVGSAGLLAAVTGVRRVLPSLENSATRESLKNT